MSKRPPPPPRSWTDADVAARRQLFEQWRYERRVVADEPTLAPAEPVVAPIRDEALQTIIDAPPPPRARVDGERAARQAPDDLAEAQLGLAARCAVCGKPVVGRDVPRDRAGRPRHHRCPR